MGKRLWMLCWGLVVMMAMTFGNVSAVEAEENWNIREDYNGDRVTEGPHGTASLGYLRGTYRLKEIYPQTDNYYEGFNFLPEDVGMVIEIKFNDWLVAYVKSAPSNSRFARALAACEREKIASNRPNLKVELIQDITYHNSEVDSPVSAEGVKDGNYGDACYLLYTSGNTLELWEEVPYSWEAKPTQKAAVFERID